MMCASEYVLISFMLYMLWVGFIFAVHSILFIRGKPRERFRYFTVKHHSNGHNCEVKQK